MAGQPSGDALYCRLSSLSRANRWLKALGSYPGSLSLVRPLLIGAFIRAAPDAADRLR
jgi:hypothetical protein